MNKYSTNSKVIVRISRKALLILISWQSPIRVELKELKKDQLHQVQKREQQYRHKGIRQEEKKIKG